MPDSDPSAHALDVPGARLYYERRGTGPFLLMIGSPMDHTGFAGLAGALAGDYTVVTYDPRCIGNSSREDPSQDVTPDQQADDVHRLLSALGDGPASVFGSSGGATAYATYIQQTGIEAYKATPGNRGAWLLWRPDGEKAEIITLSFWESRQAIEGFAGQDIEKAVFYPEDDRFLVERDLTAHHYEVASAE